MLKLLAKAQATFDTAKTFIKDEKGATAIEYGLLAVGVALAILAVIFTMGDELEKSFKAVSDGLAKRP